MFGLDRNVVCEKCSTNKLGPNSPGRYFPHKGWVGFFLLPHFLSSHLSRSFDRNTRFGQLVFY